MKATILTGPASAGKTTTLKMLIAMLLPGAEEIIYSSKSNVTAAKLWGEIEEELVTKPQDLKNITVALRFGELIVGVRTVGDTYGEVESSVRIFDEYECDIAVFPCHPCTTEEAMLRKTYGGMMVSLPKIKLPKAVSDEKKYQKNLSTATELFQDIMRQI